MQVKAKMKMAGKIMERGALYKNTHTPLFIKMPVRPVSPAQALCTYFPLEFRKPGFKFSHLLHHR